MKTLGYYHDMSFNAFLYPNPKDTRKLLGFLFEFIFKSEDEGERHEASNEWEAQVQRRLAKWRGKPWVLPDFLKIKRPLFLGGGDRINVREGVDYQRIA